jgi:hypothetical protein
VSINGRDITTQLLAPDKRRILVSLSVTDEAGIKSDTCTLVIDNRGGFPAPKTGELMEVWMGYEPEPEYMGKFRIDEWEKSGPPNILTVSAKSAELTTEIKETKHKPWDDTTLGNIVQNIAGSHGLSSVMTGDLASRKVEHIDQHGESDLAFLSRLAKRNGAMFKLADGKVIFVKRGTKLPSGKGKTERTLKPTDNVVSWRLRKSERGEHKSVICYWHDHDGGRRRKVTAGSGHPVHRDKRIYRTEEEARAAAEGQLGDFQRGKCDSSLEMGGTPDFFAESLVTLSGFDDDVDGTYNAKSVTHTFDSSGYRTSVALEALGDSESDSSE